jgi:hypothetical protein
MVTLTLRVNSGPFAIRANNSKLNEQASSFNGVTVAILASLPVKASKELVIFSDQIRGRVGIGAPRANSESHYV